MNALQRKWSEIKAQFTPFKFAALGKGLPMDSFYGAGARQAVMDFGNGFGVSVVKHNFSHGGSSGLFELAVLDVDGVITYETPITNDVLGYLEERNVSAAMIRVQALRQPLLVSLVFRAMALLIEKEETKHKIKDRFANMVQRIKNKA